VPPHLVVTEGTALGPLEPRQGLEHRDRLQDAVLDLGIIVDSLLCEHKV
jgi:hypothetical protein